jgi:hypothetical protein
MMGGNAHRTASFPIRSIGRSGEPSREGGRAVLMPANEDGAGVTRERGVPLRQVHAEVSQALATRAS